LRAWSVIVATGLGVVPWYQVFLLYGLGIMSLGLNYVRNLVAHHYQSDGRPSSYVEQLGDSVNIEGVPVFTELFFPLNLRYHALHHLFPTLPYHNLPQAHRRLLAELPADSLYHQTVFPGFFSVAMRRIKDAWAGTWKSGVSSHKAAQWYVRRRHHLRNWSAQDQHLQGSQEPDQS
jgi:fatty acid desaturase